MRIRELLFVTGLLACGATAPAAAPNLVVAVGGEMRVELSAPFTEPADFTVPVTAGRVEIAPIVFVPGVLGRFALNHVSLTFVDFSVGLSAFGTQSFESPGAHLRDAVTTVVGAESSPGVFDFRLLPDEIQFYGAVLHNDDRKDGLARPVQDVTGTIDLNTGAFGATVVIKERQHVQGLGVDALLTITLTGAFTPHQQDGRP
jgi:hypothetical protein